MENNKKTIVVSGCTKGIGRAICEHFAEAGFNIAGFARNKNDVEEMNKYFENRFSNQQFLFLPADASKKSEVINFATEVKNKFQTIDILINNAGVFLPGNILEEADGTIEKMMDTNVLSAYHLTREILPRMIEKKNGHVFNMCSIASIKAYENGGSYTISKFAMLGFSKQLRMETQNKNIKVTAIMPGATLTDSWGETDLPSTRFIEPSAIAKTIFSIYSLSDSADVEEIIIRPQLGDL
jgi:NADP-dependent 3-hydroxy acid dehydrogenase YdfG